MGIYENLKDIAKIIQESGKIESYRQVIETMEQSLELQNENKKLRDEIERIINQLKIKEELIYKDNAYWKISDNDGPFCSRCWDKNQDLIRMHNNKNIFYTCPECKNVFNGPDHHKLSQGAPGRIGGSWLSR